MPAVFAFFFLPTLRARSMHKPPRIYCRAASLRTKRISVTIAFLPLQLGTLSQDNVETCREAKWLAQRLVWNWFSPATARPRYAAQSALGRLAIETIIAQPDLVRGSICDFGVG